MVLQAELAAQRRVLWREHPLPRRQRVPRVGPRGRRFPARDARLELVALRRRPMKEVELLNARASHADEAPFAKLTSEMDSNPSCNEERRRCLEMTRSLKGWAEFRLRIKLEETNLIHA